MQYSNIFHYIMLRFYVVEVAISDLFLINPIKCIEDLVKWSYLIMKKYIIITADIHPIGGMQLYTVGKAEYLSDNGWKVWVLYSGSNKADCAIKSLNKYVDGAFNFLEIRPYLIPRLFIKKALQHVVDLIEREDSDEIYIESQADVQALWGELLAKKINAKHICFSCNEQFRGLYKHYEDNIDFFWFKFQRRELLGIRTDSMKKLFEGYYNVPEGNEFVFDAVEADPIQNIHSTAVDEIKRLDYNIAYLGRVTKGYVPNIVLNVAQFAGIHLDKKIQFIIVGDATERRAFIDETLGRLENVKITYMGDMVPIPRAIYSKIDVMIAGAACAEVSAREGVPTIVADCENYLANGVLGYTVNSSLQPDLSYGQHQFVDELNDVLITKKYLKFPYSFPESDPTDLIYRNHLQFYLKSEKKKKYYDVLNKKKIIKYQDKTIQKIYLYYKTCLYELVSLLKKYIRLNCQFKRKGL